MGVALGVVFSRIPRTSIYEFETNLRGTGLHTAHRRESVLGHRTHEAALRVRSATCRWEEIRDRLITEAKLVREEDIEINRAIGRNGAPLVARRKNHSDALQRGSARHRGLRYRARRHSRGSQRR